MIQPREMTQNAAVRAFNPSMSPPMGVQSLCVSRLRSWKKVDSSSKFLGSGCWSDLEDTLLLSCCSERSNFKGKDLFRLTV